MPQLTRPLFSAPPSLLFWRKQKDKKQQRGISGEHRPNRLPAARAAKREIVLPVKEILLLRNSIQSIVRKLPHMAKQG